MEKIKKPLSLICALFLASSAMGFSACADVEVESEPENKIKNVILLIGDGMGENHIENAKTYFELGAQIFEADRAGEIVTLSLSGVTDSAAAATALATGTKVSNREIGKSNDGDLTSISELAKAAGKKVGIVTTDSLDGATPAGFSAHADDRGDSEEIARTQAESDIDLFMGQAKGGYPYYNTYGKNFTDNGYEFALTPEEMTAKAETEKLVVTLPEVLSSYAAGNESDYQLKDMATFALDFLENENGFFLMIEGAYIDKFSHDNDIANTLCETRSFFDAIDAVYDWAETHGETAILITADHETGWLEKAGDKSEISDELYHSGGHTLFNVPIYLKNFSYDFPTVAPQNTAVFELCKKLLNV